METHPSRGRAIAGAATAGQGISPSDYARSLYIAPGNREMPTIVLRGKISPHLLTKPTFPPKPQLFQLGKNDTMGKSHPLLNWERNAISRFNKCALFLAQHHSPSSMKSFRLLAKCRKESPSATQNKRSSSGRL